MNPCIRPADQKDALGIASVHVRTWQKAYRGSMPDSYLDNIKVSDRHAFWEKELADIQSQKDKNIFVVEIENNVVGFLSLGPARDIDDLCVGEIYAIHIDPDYWRCGLGSSLLNKATDELQKSGFSEAVLWVLAENHRANQFYQIHGWSFDGACCNKKCFGATTNEIRYRKVLAKER